MTQKVPTGPRIDRAALERIIQRAAELQADEREIGDGLSEEDLLKLGQDVGIPDRYLQQALLEERTRSVVVAEPGVLNLLVGPRRTAAERVITGDASRLDMALNQWMTDGELLAVKRRYPNQTSWEARQGAFAALRRALPFGERQYHLARTREVVGEVRPVDANSTYVALVADVTNSRKEHLVSALAVAGAGVIATTVGLLLGAHPGVAVVPVVLALPGALWVARRRLDRIDRIQLALEQVIDRLEYGEQEPPPRVRAPRQSAFVRMAQELRKSLSG